MAAIINSLLTLSFVLQFTMPGLVSVTDYFPVQSTPGGWWIASVDAFRGGFRMVGNVGEPQTCEDEVGGVCAVVLVKEVWWGGKSTCKPCVAVTFDKFTQVETMLKLTLEPAHIIFMPLVITND